MKLDKKHKRVVIIVIALVMILMTIFGAKAIDWTEATSSSDMGTRIFFGYTVFNGETFVCGGYDGGYYWRDCRKSSNGVNWTSLASNVWGYGYGVVRFGMTSFDSKMWIAGGIGWGNFPQGRILSSTDGITWADDGSLPNWGGGDYRRDFSMLTFNGKMYILGGYCSSVYDCGKEVISSSNGVNWTIETHNDSNGGSSAVVYDNKIWWFGGGDGNEVWSSTNGADWAQINSNASWSERTAYSVVLNDKMWIVGGENLNDVWYSDNGINWTQAITNETIWSARSGYGVVNMDDKMWVLGGWSGSFLPDVWYSEGLINESGPVCGNDIIEGDELCDNWNVTPHNCTSLGFIGGYLACNFNCTAYDVRHCLSSLCGNGIIESGEQCDNGGLNGVCPGCDSNCKICGGPAASELPEQPPVFAVVPIAEEQAALLDFSSFFERLGLLWDVLIVTPLAAIGMLAVIASDFTFETIILVVVMGALIMLARNEIKKGRKGKRGRKR